MLETTNVSIIINKCGLSMHWYMLNTVKPYNIIGKCRLK